MRLEFFVDTYRPYVSGVVTAVDILANHLTQRGHGVTINAPSYPDNETGDAGDSHVRRIPSLPFPGYEGLRIAAPLPFSLSPKEPLDLVHAHSPFPMGMAAQSLAREHRVPMVYTCHSLYPDYSEYVPWASSTVRKVLEAHMQYFCNRCDAIIAPSDHVRGKLLEWGITRPIHVSPTGIELEPFESVDRDEARDWILRRHRIAQDRFVLLFVGRLAQEKNLEHLLSEIRHLCQLNGGPSSGTIQLLLVGTGPHEETLRDRAAELGVEDCVTFAGTVDRERVVRYYRGADAFAFPSVSETQGIVLLEALAGALPVVAISSPVTRETVRNGVEGLLVGTQRGALSRALRQLQESRNLRDVLSAGALRRARDFSAGRMVARLESIYDEVQRTYRPGPRRTARDLLQGTRNGLRRR